MKKGIVFAMCSIFLAGCTTKSYVRNQVAPLIQKVNALDDETAKNSRQIHDVDTRAQQEAQALNDKASAADQNATTASQNATQAEQTANSANTRVNSLIGLVASLDNYQTVAQVSVLFQSGRDDLTAEDAQMLNDLINKLPKDGGYVITMEGSTDSSGGKEYNYTLSDRRTAAVMQYLTAKQEVPVQTIHSVGLGEDKPVASNNTAEGRARNRRVDVSLMARPGRQQTVQSGQMNPGAVK
jgi:outer membrane protein OmpA-like peptidoglycan-associated protein